MVLLNTTSLNLQGKYQEYGVAGADIDICLDMINYLVEAGCHLLSLKLVLTNGTATPLPIEAFDGEPMQKALQLLQREWEEVLLDQK